VPRARRPRRSTTLLHELSRRRPELDSPLDAIVRGLVLVDGSVVTNPASRVGPDASIALSRRTPLKGESKLEPALAGFHVPVEGRVALDVGAAAGGFTAVLLRHGARRVYAVDAGFGQLVGSLRQDPRVVNLERTNLADLDRGLVPDPIDLLTLDLSFLSLTDAVPQLQRLQLHASADMVALVKPMFELRLPEPPGDLRLQRALDVAVAGIEDAGWRVIASMRSPVLGSRGAQEFLVHARLTNAAEAR